MTNIFVDISLVLALTAVFAAIFNWLRQPLVLAYLLVGVIAASSGLFVEINQGETLDFLAELGIAFVLFLIGLELKFSDIKQIGRAAIFVGVGQIIFTSFFGFLISTIFLGLAATEAFYLSLALTFSSTIIVVKLLGEKRDLDSLYGKIAVGYLIVQDLAAIGVLIFLTSISGSPSLTSFFVTFVKGTALVALILILNKYVLQNLFDRLAKSSEVLFLTSISWALIFATVSSLLGFSIEIGAFLAGLGLASLREEAQIASWIRPLRNLFVILFFLSLGLKLSITTISSLLLPTLALSIFVLVGNPLIMMIVMGFLGFRSRTGFQVGTTSAQVSEFSLIVVFLGHRLGVISSEIVSLTASTALVTIILSTYLIKHSSRIYKLLAPYAKIFQKKTLVEKPLREEKDFSGHVVLVGAGRLGTNILDGLLKKGEKVVVIDFDPTMVKKLEAKNIPVIYGDISDPEILQISLGRETKMVISTVFDSEDTRNLLSEIRKYSAKIPVLVTSATAQTALEFYKMGASYVIVPRILSSDLIEKYITSAKFEELISGGLKKDHIEQLSTQNS